MLTHYLQVSSADNFCKQFGPRSCSTKGQAWSGSNLFDTQMVFLKKKFKLERAVDGAPSQIPTLKFLTPPAPRSPTPGHDLGNRMKILFNMFSIFFIFVRTHTKFGIKIFEIDMLMIFDLLTSPQDHQFDPRMKMLLAFSSARHPRRFDMLHDHV